ncbi:MAG: acylphosphatase [Aeromonadales bacterium]|nr:acylphosphatase [Aeromonadales bacterium]
MAATAIQFMISGKVQQVGFRAHTQRQAERLNLTGYARNLADGRVEVWAEGDRDGLQALLAWLQHGPIEAKVDEVMTTEVTPARHATFITQ